MLVQRSALERLSPADPPKKQNTPVVVFVLRVGLVQTILHDLTLYPINLGNYNNSLT